MKENVCTDPVWKPVIPKSLKDICPIQSASSATKAAQRDDAQSTRPRGKEMSQRLTEE